MCVALVSYIVAWFVDRHSDPFDKAFNFMFFWMVIGWFPMGGLGFLVGLSIGYLTGMPNEYTTGGLLSGMALYIPTGILAYHLHLKTL